MDGSSEYNTVFHCTWAPRIWLCDKRSNRLRIDDRRRSLLARCVTYAPFCPLPPSCFIFRVTPLLQI